MTELPEDSDVGTTRVLAGILALIPVVNCVGVHKFYLGLTTAGIITIAVTVASCLLLSPMMLLTGICEGIIYLTKSDEEFYQLYMVEKKQWF